jgi:kojibiose phosphorylase
MQPLAVIFDMDGVLCNTDDLHYQSWQKALAGTGIPFNPDINHGLRGLSRTASLDKVLNGQLIGEDERKAILERKNQAYVQSLEKLTQKNLLPGVLDLINELQAARIKIGVASASQHVTRVLNQLRISETVEAFCDGVMVRDSKPAPTPYLFVSSQLGVEPKNCLAIEDSQAGIISARKAGMCVIALGSQENLVGANAIVSTLEEVNLMFLNQVFTAFRMH